MMTDKQIARDLEFARRDMMKGKCVGGCANHDGDIQVVRVTHPNHDWGYFSYCKTARDEDVSRGLIVLLA